MESNWKYSQFLGVKELKNHGETPKLAESEADRFFRGGATIVL
jgi:hypothetical protein